jgi:hypothetical protein
MLIKQQVDKISTAKHACQRLTVLPINLKKASMESKKDL